MVRKLPDALRGPLIVLNQKPGGKPMKRVSIVNGNVCTKSNQEVVPNHGLMILSCSIRACLTLTALFVCLVAIRAQEVTPLTSEQVINRISPSVVLVLAGRGGGRLEATGSGVIVRENGVLLTAYHRIKNAHEVQVRLKSGEVYDKVELLGFDERRDVAALRIAAKGLPTLPSAGAEAGQRIYVVSNPAGLRWSAAEGLLSAVRLADDVPGTGSGYQLLQFTAPVSPGSSGGVLVDAQARMLGVIVASKNGQNLNFAVPVNAVIGLADATVGTPLGSGSNLRLPTPEAPPSSVAVASTNATERLREVKTVYVRSNTSYFEPVQLQNDLRKRPEFVAWQLLIVDDVKVADAMIEVDRPLFTFTFTYTLTDRKTSVVLASGKVTAWDGNLAAPGLAKEIVKQIKTARPFPEKKAAAK